MCITNEFDLPYPVRQHEAVCVEGAHLGADLAEH